MPLMAARRTTLGEVGEMALLAGLLPTLPSRPGIVVGPGDDCAVLRARHPTMLFTIDALVEGVHFRRGWLSLRQLGRKAFLVNASDIAAMGGAPRWCVVNITAPPDTPSAGVVAISQGVAAAAVEVGAALVGGNLSRSRDLSVTVALVGDAPPRPLTRTGAQVGDRLGVTGRLGEAALAVRELRRGRIPRGRPIRRYREPTPRLGFGAALARGSLASAAIDVSDGVLQDLGHLCRASGVGARVELEALPCSTRIRRFDLRLALTGGEDYELLCAVPPRHCRTVERLARARGCGLAWIGNCVEWGAGVRVIDGRGRVLSVAAAGHDHFSRRPR